jgi:hypothetical protein
MQTIVISSAEDVAALAKDVRTGKRRVATEIILRLDVINNEQADRLSKEINRYYFACACNEATALGLAGLILSLIWVSSRLDTWRDIGWQYGVAVIGAFIVATGIGKAIGRHRARRLLRNAVGELVSLVPKAQEIGKGDGSVTCAVGG